MGESKSCVSCGGELTGRQRSYCSETCSKASARRSRLAQHFDITPEEYDQILAAQGGVCAVCGRPPKPGKRLAVDHDHRTGFVRGLLCFMCNKRILGARTTEAIVALAEYVKNPPAHAVIGQRFAPGRPKKQRKKRATRRTVRPR